MRDRLKTTLPLAVAVGILAFIWCEVSLNFTFHWVTDGDLGNGLALPANFHLVTPAAFVSWAMFFAAGADRAAAGKVALASTIGAGCGLVLGLISPKIADLPDFYGVAVVTALIAVLVVLASAISDYYFTPAVIGGFAAVVFWWIATGLDGWAPDGGGVGNSVAALGKPETAGSGAFGGVISTPVEWVFVSVAVSLLAGVLLGQASVKLAAVLTGRRARPAQAAVEA
ncbi:MAG: DUF1097 family protein [Acidimicrobiia bacterium]|nr:DUF1097 family protein [Acidimicrobiia bacterium]